MQVLLSVNANLREPISLYVLSNSDSSLYMYIMPKGEISIVRIMSANDKAGLDTYGLCFVDIMAPGCVISVYMAFSRPVFIFH